MGVVEAVEVVEGDIDIVDLVEVVSEIFFGHIPFRIVKISWWKIPVSMDYFHKIIVGN